MNNVTMLCIFGARYEHSDLQIFMSLLAVGRYVSTVCSVVFFGDFGSIECCVEYLDALLLLVGSSLSCHKTPPEKALHHSALPFFRRFQYIFCLFFERKL